MLKVKSGIIFIREEGQEDQRFAGLSKYEKGNTDGLQLVISDIGLSESSRGIL